MNIFKALSQGNGRISETNITSFLSYLLDNQSEIGASFLLIFLELIDNNLTDPAKHSKKLLKMEKQDFRENLILFKDKYSFASVPEFRIASDDQVKIPDILLKIMDKSEEEDLAYFLIENKIKRSARKEHEAKEAFNLFSNSEDCQKGAEIYSIILTIDDGSFSNMLASLKTVNQNSCWLKWTNFKSSENSVVGGLKRLLRLDQNAEIQPINPNTQFIIRSFIDYISTEYSFRENEDRNFSINGSDVVSSASVNLEASDVKKIKRYDNGMIRLFDEHDNEIKKIVVKPILREINRKFKLGIQLLRSNGRAKNTQVLGRELIEALNDQMKIKTN